MTTKREAATIIRPPDAVKEKKEIRGTEENRWVRRFFGSEYAGDRRYRKIMAHKKTSQVKKRASPRNKQPSNKWEQIMVFTHDFP